jgi:o-succinylbenzoate synthase
LKLRGVGWTTFRLPFRESFTTAHGTLEVREGIIVRLVTEDDATGLGEASPVPGFGGSLIEIKELLSALARRVVDRDLTEIDALLEELNPNDPTSAAVAFALDTAAHDLRGQKAGCSIATLLDGDPAVLIPVHAVVAVPTTAGAVAAAQKAVAAGFRWVKLKVGVSRSEQSEITRIAAVRGAIGPDIRLRLDANESWSVAEAVAIIRAAERFDLDLVEQPVDRGDLAGMAQVRCAVSTPIAADEAASGINQARQVVALGAADVLVVKPMLAGRLLAARQMFEEARRAGLQAFVTTTLDSGVGVAAAVQLAATLAAPGVACGLATGPLLADDLTRTPLSVGDGRMRVPSSPGLGVTLDEDAVRRFGSPWEVVGR